MMTRELKLKLNKKQQSCFDEYLWLLTGVYNWTIRKIKLSAGEGIYYSYEELQNITSSHAKKIGVHSQVLQQTIRQAHNSWDRCFKKLGGEPKLKSAHLKMRSFVFPQFDNKKLKDRTIKLPSLGEIKYHKQLIPEGKIKIVRVVKKSSGWYAQLTIEAIHNFKLKETEEKVGIDTGFKFVAILSNGKKYENERNFVKGQKRLAQAQRGKNKKLVARLHEKIRNRRKDYNHKVSKEIVQKYKEIYITKDNLRGQSKIFGKSVSDAGISQLRNFILYKSENHGRVCELIKSKNTTMTCSNCGALNGPTGLNGLDVRYWECACGANHDRDINSAINILNIGLGTNLVQSKTG